MNKILVGIHGRPSIKNVYSLMNNPNVEVWVRRRVRLKKGGVKEYWRVYSEGDSSKYRVEYHPRFENDVILRWGNEIQIEHPGCKIYNESRAIALASQKGRARQVMHDSGVRVPNIVTRDNFITANYPVIARPQVHAKGKNIVVLNCSRDFDLFYESHRDWYFAEFYPKDREVRCHVFMGKFCPFN